MEGVAVLPLSESSGGDKTRPTGKLAQQVGIVCLFTGDIRIAL
jgi:hypothetical protein